jgi:hypothetical protein
MHTPVFDGRRHELNEAQHDDRRRHRQFDCHASLPEVAAPLEFTLSASHIDKAV